MREFFLTANATIKCSNAPSFILVTLTIGTYENINPVGETKNLNEKEDSTFFGPQQGQQTLNLELWSKPFVVPQSGM